MVSGCGFVEGAAVDPDENSLIGPLRDARYAVLLDGGPRARDGQGDADGGGFELGLPGGRELHCEPGNIRYAEGFGHQGKGALRHSPELPPRPDGAGEDNTLPTYGLRTKVWRLGWATLTEHKWGQFWRAPKDLYGDGGYQRRARE